VHLFYVGMVVVLSYNFYRTNMKLLDNFKMDYFKISEISVFCYGIKVYSCLNNKHFTLYNR